MKKTPLYDQHIELKARIVDFAGYAMPVMYAGIKDEYLAVRNQCGIFDISHMCPIHLHANDANVILKFINYITCRDISKMKNGKIQYNAVPSSQGGLLDDITVYKINDNDFILLVNASNSEKIINHLETWRHKGFDTVEIHPFENYVLLALQGKDSESRLKKMNLMTEKDISSLFFYEFTLISGYDKPYFISRTGYTGEDGFEILLPSDAGISLWKNLIGTSVIPCGLGARDILRMEVFYPLYGNELNETRTPIESSIEWILSTEKDYLGKESIFKTEPREKIAGFIMKEKGGLPRSHYPVVNNEGRKIGEVTSGGFSFLWDRGFGMAIIEPEYYKDGNSIFIDIRGNKAEAVIHLKSPYNGSIKRRSK